MVCTSLGPYVGRYPPLLPPIRYHARTHCCSYWNLCNSISDASPLAQSKCACRAGFEGERCERYDPTKALSSAISSDGLKACAATDITSGHCSKHSYVCPEILCQPCEAYNDVTFRSGHFENCQLTFRCDPREIRPTEKRECEERGRGRGRARGRARVRGRGGGGEGGGGLCPYLREVGANCELSCRNWIRTNACSKCETENLSLEIKNYTTCGKVAFCTPRSCSDIAETSGICVFDAGKVAVENLSSEPKCACRSESWNISKHGCDHCSVGICDKCPEGSG